MDIFSVASHNIHTNGFSSFWTVLEVAIEGTPWLVFMFIGNFSENDSLFICGLSKAMPLRQQAAVLRGT